MTPLWTFWQCAILMGISLADTAWRALRASAQNPNPEDVTSNTQWSLVYDDTALTAQIALRRNWDDVDPLRPEHKHDWRVNDYADQAGKRALHFI